MFTYRAEFPQEWTEARIYTLADLHIGDSHCVEAEVMRRIRQAEEDPHGLVLLNGDICNTALRHSVSDVYTEVLTPMQQMHKMVELLRPVKDKIIGVTTGNHEHRAYKDAGLDITRTVCREIGIEDRYSPEGILVFLRFGHKTEDRHSDRAAKQWYTIYATHGSGGGRKEGAKAIRLADMASIVDADVYVHSHTHLPMVMKQSFFRTDERNCSVRLVPKLFVNTGAALGYGGYGQAQEFKPSSIDTPVIYLSGSNKYATATL